MAIVDRVKKICLTPATEWTVIEGESASPAGLISGYVAPLAAIGAVAGFIGGTVVGRSLPYIGTYRVGVMAGLVGAIFAFAMAIVGVAVLAFVINALAPTFGAQKNSVQAWKLAVYSYTPAWVAGALQIFPLLGTLAILAALYGIYLMYLGVPKLMKCPPEKAVGYTAVIVVCAIVVSVVLGSIAAIVTGAGMAGSRALAGVKGAPADSDVRFDKNSALGKLQALGDKLDESTKKMDAAGKAGDTKAEMAAAFEGLGTLLGGGKRVEPLAIEDLKAFVPDTLAGLPKASSSAEKNGIAGVTVSKAEATYGEGDKKLALTISDSGGVSGLVGLASWAGAQDEREDASGFERTRMVNGRMVHEKMSKNGGRNEYGIVVGERFMVSATSSDVDLDTLKAAVSQVDLAGLESKRNAGVTK